MATNIEQIFRSFVVNKFKEIQEEQLNSENNESSQNGELMAQATESTSGNNTAMHVESEGCPQSVENVEKMQSEALDLENPHSSALEENSSSKEMKPSEVSSSDEVKKDASRKKSKKHKKHKSKKKKKKKKKEKRSKSISSIEDQENVHLEPKSMWKPAFSSPAKEDAIVDLDSKTELVSETDVAFITPTVSSTQGTILDSVTENQTCTKIQVDGDSEFFGPKCPTEINYTNSIDCSIQEESEGVCDKSKHVTGHTEIVKQMEGHTAETMPHSNLPENDLLQPCLVTTHLKATESNSNKLQRLDQSASSPALCHLPDKTKTGDKLRSKSIEKSIPTASRSRSRSKSIVKEVKQKLNSKSPLLESCTLSTSMTQRRRSRSSSLRPRKRSRSKSYSKGQRSRSSTPARYSKSPIRSWWSKSIRNRQRSRSLSVVGRQRSSTRSPVRRRNSRTGSLRRRHRSKSRSSVRRLTSRSRSQSRRRRSQSKSPAIKRRSRSVSPLRTRRSRPSSRAKRLKSRSKSAVRRRRSRSVSAVRRHKSRSQSVARTQKSRSPSAARRRRLSRSTSAARRRRSSRSSSAARRRRSSRSPSAARRRRSSLSPSAARRRRSSRSPSAARRRRSSRSPSAARRRRSSRSTSAVRRRRSSRSTSAARRRRSSRSTSAARRRRSSRSTSAARRRRSSRSTSAARRRRSSRSTSAARRRRSSRSTSAARRRRSSRSTSAARRRRSSRSTSAARRRRSSRSTSAARRRRSSRSTSAARRRRSSRSTSAARRRRSSSPLRKQLSTSRSGTGRDHSRSRSIMRKQKSRSRSIDKHSSSLEGKSRSHSETKEQCSKSSVKKMETACSPKAKNDNLKLANISPTTLLQTNSPDKENRPCHGMLTEFVNVSSSTVLRPEFTLSPVVATRKELQGAFFHVEAAVLADTPSTLCDTIFPPIGPSSESDAVKDMALDGITDPNSKQSSLKEGEIVCIDLQKEMLMSEIDLQQPCARTSSDTPKHENQANMGISEPTQNTAQPCINSNVLKRDPVKFNPASTYGAGIATSFAENKHSVESECSILSSSSVAEFTFIDTSSKAELKPLHSEQTASLPINTEFSISHLAQDSPQQSPFREQGKPSREEKTELNTDHDLGNSEPLQSELKMNKDGSKSSCKPEMIVHNTSASVNSEGYQTLQTDLIADMEVCQNNKSTEQDSFDSSKPNEQSFFACDAGTSTKPDSSLSQDKFDTGAERRISLSSESDRSILKNKEVFLDHPEANNKTLPENRLIEDSEISIHQKSVITKFVDNTVTESSNYCKATSVEQRPFLSVLPKTRDSNMTHLASPRSSECLHQDHPSDNSVVHFASKPSQPLDHKDLIIPQPLQVPQSHVSQLPKNDSLLALQEYSSKDALRKPEKKLTTEATFHTGQFSPVPVLSSEKNDAPLSSPSGSSDSNICKGTTNDSQLSSKSGVLGPSTVDSTQSDAFENRNLRKQTDPPENISKSTVPTKVQHSTSGDIFPYQGTSKDSCRTFHSSNEKHSLSFDSNKVPGTTVDHTHKSRVQHTKTTKEPLDIIVQDIVAQPSDSDRRHSSVQKQEYDLATVAKTIDSEEGQAAMYDRSGDTTKDYIETNSKLISSKRSIGLSRLPADTFEVKKSAEPKSSKKMNFSFKEHTSNVYQENRSDSSMRNKSSANFEKDSLKTCPQTMHSETQSSFVNQMSTIAGCSSELTTGAKTKACLTTDNETQKSDGNGRQNLGQSIALSNPVNFKFSRTFKPINIAPIQVPSEAIVSSNLESSKIGMLPLRDPLKFASSAVDSTKSGPLQSNLQDVKERKDSCNTTATKSQECGKISDLVVNPHPAADNVLPKVLSDLEPVNASTATTTTPSTVQLHAQVVITSLQPSALKSISAPVERKVSPGSQVSEKSGDSVETSGSDHLQQSNLVTSDSSQSSTAIKHTFPHLSNTTSKTVKQRHYRSRSMTQESRSPSMDRGRTSRSKSPQRKRRSRSKSYVRKSSKSSTRRRRSRSKSGGKRRRSRSKSKGRRKHSPSKLAGRRRHSRSKSAERKRRSKSSDRSKRVRSKSPPVRKRQSRSRSATRKKRSRSKLGRRRVSRSISPVRRRRSRSKSVSTRSRSHSKSASWRHSSGSKSTVRRRHSRSSSKSTSPRRRSLSRRVHSVSKSPVPQRRTRSRSSTRRQSSKSRGRWRRSRSFSTSRRRSRSSSRPRSVSSKKRHSSSKSPNRRPRSQSKTKLKENSPLSRDKSKSSSPPQKKIQSKSTPFKHSIGLKSLIQKQLSQAKLQSSSGKGSSKEQLPLTSLTAKAPLNISNVSTKTQLQNSIRSNKAQSSVTRSQLSMSGLNARTQMPMSNAPSEGQVTLPDLSSETVSPLTMSELTTGTPWSIPNMVVGSQWPVSDLATGSQWTMSEMTAGAHWPVSDLSTGTQWPVSDLTSGSQWAVPDLTGGSQWAVPDLTGGSQWAVPDLTGGSQWAVPDLAAGSQWTVPNLAAGSQWTVSHLATGTHWTMPNIPSASQLPGSCLLTETHVAMPTLVAGSQVAVPALPKETQPAETPSTVSELDTKDQIAVSETPLIVNEPEVKTQLTVNETAPADLLVGNEPTPDTLTLVNEAILETLPEAKEQTSSIQPAVIAVVGAPTAETQSLVEETDLKTQDVNKLHEVKIPMNEMAAPDYQAAFHDSPSQSKVQSIKEVSQAQSIVSKSESNSDSSACKLPLNEGQSLCSEHNSVIQISSSNPPLSPDKQDFLHNIPLPDSPSNSLCLQHDEATSNKENMLHHKSLAYPSQIPHVDLPQLADLNTSPKHSTLAGQSSSHEQESLGVEYPFVTSDATFVAEQSSCVDQSKVAEHSDPHDDPLMTKPVEVNSHLKAQSFGSPQQTTLPTDHDTQQIFSETCPESKSPLNVEPCTSPDCVMLVEPYVSPEHSGLTSYTSPSSSHVALPWVNPTQSLLIESCAEHNKQPSLDESYTSPCRPVLVEPYVSPDHSLPSDPDDSSELTGLLKTGTLPEPSVELEVSLKPNENTNASLPVVHCDNTSQSLTDSYATLNNPSSSILPLLVEPYTSPIHPILVEPYVSPDHSPIIEQYTISPYDEVYTSCAKPYVDEFCAAPAQSPVVEPFAANSHSTAVECFPASVHAVEHLVKSDSNEVKNVSAELHNYNKQSSNCNYTESYVGLKPSQTPHTYAGSEPYGSTQCHPSSEQYDSSHQPLSTEPSTKPNYSVPFSSLLQKPTAIFSQPLQSETVTSEKPFPDHPNISREYPFSSQRTSTPPLSSTHCPISAKPYALVDSSTFVEAFVSPQHPHPAEPCASPALPLPAEPCASPALPLPAEPCASPALPLPAEPCASPALPLPAEPCASPALPLPAEPCASPALPLPAEPCASPLLTERPVFGDVDHCASPVQTLGESLTTVRPLAVDESCSSPVYSLLAAGPSASLLLPFSTESYTNTLLPEPCVVANSFLVAAEPLTSPDQTVVVVEPFIGIECPAGSSVSPDSFLQSSEPSESPVLPLLPADTCSGLDAKLLASEPCPRPDQMVLASEQSSSRAVLTSASHVITPSSYNDLHTNPLAEPFAITEQSLTEEPCVSPHLPFVEQPCNSPHVQNRHLVEESCPSPQCPSIEDPCVGTHQHIVKLLPFCPPHPTIEEMAPSHRHHHNIEEPFSSSDHSTVQESTGPSSRLLEEEPCVVPNIFIVKDPEIVTDHVVEKEPSVVPNCPIVIDPCVSSEYPIIEGATPNCPNVDNPPNSTNILEGPCASPYYSMVEEPCDKFKRPMEEEPTDCSDSPPLREPCIFPQSYPEDDLNTVNDKLLNKLYSSPKVTQFEPCALHEQSTSCYNSPLEEPVTSFSEPCSPVCSLTDKSCGSPDCLMPIEPCGSPDRHLQSEPCGSPYHLLPEEPCENPDCSLPENPYDSPKQSVAEHSSGTSDLPLIGQPLESPSISLRDGPSCNPQHLVSEESFSAQQSLSDKALFRMDTVLSDDTPFTASSLLSDDTPSGASSSLLDEAPSGVGSLPDEAPSGVGSSLPDETPSGAGSSLPDETPSGAGSSLLAEAPSGADSSLLAEAPSGAGSSLPAEAPSGVGSLLPDEAPSGVGSLLPDEAPSGVGSLLPDEAPSGVGSWLPDEAPSGVGSSLPDEAPSGVGSSLPDEAPSGVGSSLPDEAPSGVGSSLPGEAPSGVGSSLPGEAPSGVGSSLPGEAPSGVGSSLPGETPSGVGSSLPGETPSGVGSSLPGEAPSGVGSSLPGEAPSGVGSSLPEEAPSGVGSWLGDEAPSGVGSSLRDEAPSGVGSSLPDEAPSGVGSSLPDEAPSGVGSSLPEEAPSGVGSSLPDEAPLSLGTEEHRIKQPCSSTNNTLLTENSASIDNQLTTPHAEFPIPYDYQNNITALTPPEQCFRDPNPSQSYGGIDTCSELAAVNAPETLFSKPPSLPSLEAASENFSKTFALHPNDVPHADQNYKTPPPELLPYDSEQPKGLNSCASETSRDHVIFTSEPPPELLPYDSEQPENPYLCIPDCSSEQASSIFQAPPELLPYDSDQPALHHTQPHTPNVLTVGIQSSSFPQTEPEVPALHQSSASICTDSNKCQLENILLDDNSSIDSLNTLSTSTDGKLVSEREIKSNLQTSDKVSSQPIGEQVSISKLSQEESPLPSEKPNDCEPELGQPTELTLSVPIQPSISKISLQPPSSSPQQVVFDCSVSEKPMPENITQQPFISELPEQCPASCDLIAVPKQQSVSLPEPEEPSTTQLDSSKKQTPSKSIAKQESASSQSNSGTRRSRSKSVDQALAQSKSEDVKRSRSRSTTRVKRSRSKSLVRQRKSRSKSTSGRKRSRSITQRRKSRSKSLTRHSQSKSATQKKRSRSPSPNRKRRSNSVARRRRSRSPSVARRRRSRSASVTRRRRSRSKSTARRRRSRSPSGSRRRRSHSTSGSRRRRSNSISAARRKRSRSTSAARRKRSRSNSGVRRRRSRSASPARRKRSCSPLPAQKRSSRSPSPSRRRRSYSKSMTPKSPVHKSRARSKSDRSRSRSQSIATRKRKTQSRSPSREQSKQSEKRRKRSTSKDHYSTKSRRRSRTPPRRKKSRSPVRRTGLCMSPIRRRRSRSPLRRKSFSRSPIRRNRSRSREKSLDTSRSPKRLTDLDKAQLLEIAKANAAAMCAKAGVPLPPSLKPAMAPSATVEEKITHRTYGVTIQELTEKCKQIAQSKEDDVIVNKPHDSDEEEEERPFYNHPFKVSEHKPISFSLLNPSIKPAPKTQVTLTKEFPVSSGSQHRKKESDKVYGEWVPVDKKTEESKDDVFTSTGPSQF